MYWEYELDRGIIDEEQWSGLGARGFDPPGHFAAFLNTLRWNCTTATDPRLFHVRSRGGNLGSRAGGEWSLTLHTLRQSDPFIHGVNDYHPPHE